MQVVIPFVHPLRGHYSELTGHQRSLTVEDLLKSYISVTMKTTKPVLLLALE